MDNQEKQQNSDRESGEFQVIDKRPFANLDLDAIDLTSIPEATPRYPVYVEELKARMAETERQFQEKKKQIDEEIARTKSRLEADFDRKLEMEKQKIILPFLEILDNLQRAIQAATQTETIEHLLEGVQMTASMFLSKLQSIGVEPIPALEQPFDPNLEQAIGTVQVNNASRDGLVVEEVQRGYLMGEQLLRPAMVRVGRFE
jgi:molecular chaperone GrpE